MSATALYVLVLLAAAAHAIWNALVKRASDAVLMMASIRLVGLAFALVVLPFVPWPHGSAWLLVILAAAATFAYYGLLIRSYRFGDLSMVYPIARGTAPVLLACLSYVVVGETLVPMQIAGIVLIVSGVLGITVGSGVDRAVLLFASATGASIAGYSFLGGIGARTSGSVVGFQAWLEIITGIGMLAFAAVRRRHNVRCFLRANAFWGLIAGTLSVGGYLAFLTAAKALPLAPVAALRECSPVFGAAIGALVFKEPFGIRRAFAAGLVSAGALAIAAYA
ncbi:MAG: EamA family transporter [Alphaproteobacteria bacterium]|nr:EamA family transporter [Alphaproteobacteria bacterium]